MCTDSSTLLWTVGKLDVRDEPACPEIIGTNIFYEKKWSATWTSMFSQYFIFFLVRAENTHRLLGCSSQYWQFYPADFLLACFIQSHCLLGQYQHKTDQLYIRHNVNHRQQSRFLTQQCLHKTNQSLPWLLSLLKQQLEIKGFLPPLHNTKQAWK